MSHALSALDHAIRGDPSGLSFLEQTASIYVLDAATTPGRPTTYGWWNFLNDALNDVERYESEQAAALGRHNVGYGVGHHAAASASAAAPGNNDLDGHVRLLATITRRAARRSPSSDRRLAGTCLANASVGLGLSMLANDPEVAQSLLDVDAELRERNMGRIAAIVFDYSFHRRSYGDGSDGRGRGSAFSDPAAMEQLCGAVAANAVSTGPAAVRHLVSDWIVPGVDSLPPLAVAAIVYHVALEAAGRGRPAGTRDALKSLVPSVFVRAIGPILVDALRESDERGYDDADAGDDAAGGGGRASIEHRTAALALRALESWCAANSIGAVKLRSIFASANVNILEAIADALYSNAEVMIDAVSDLIETLLKFDAKGANVTLGISIAGSVMSNCLPPGMTNELLMAKQITGENEKSRIAILSELFSAVGLQRFRFAERQSNGDTAVCRCLARTAAKVLLESQDLIKNGTLQASTDGLLDLLFKAASHPSVYVCGIAVESLAVIAPSNSELSTRLLPYLQGKAIIPFHLVEDADGSLDDYANFRDRVLADTLVACYTGCSAFYLESCGSAIEEFCQASPSPHLPYQLEAALFCMIAVSERASKAPDRQALCGQLEKTISALAKNSFSTTTSHPCVMAKMCRFINEYATSISSCQTKLVFETASELVFTSFKRGLNEYNQQGQLATANNASPLSEASNAFKKLLCSSPAQFSTPAARSALEDAWKMPYASQQIAIEDREMLCSGLCSVIVSLPSEQWNASLDALAQPILSCLNVVTKEADQITTGAGTLGPRENDVAPIMNRLSNEIRLLAAVVRCFIQAGTSQNSPRESRATFVASHRNALVSLLHKSWPCLTHIGNKYCSYEAIAMSIGQLLTESLSLYGSEEELPLLLEITGLAKTSLSVVARAKNPLSLAPLLSFMQKFVYLHGSKIEPSPRNNAVNQPIQVMAKNLMLISYEAVRSCKTSHENDVSQGIASPMFDTLSSCAKKCPIFLLSLSRDSQPVGEVIRSSIETAPVTLKSTQMNIVLSSIRFLKDLVSSLTSLSLESLDEGQRSAIVPVIDAVKQAVRTDIVNIVITWTCAGISPREVLEPLTNLMRTILVYSQWSDIEASVSAAIDCNQFQLGDEAKSVAFEAFKKCTESEYVAASFRRMISDMWEMHQTDDTGSIAGGEAVLDFVQRYKN